MSGTAALDELTPHIDIEDFFVNIVEATETWLPDKHQSSSILRVPTCIRGAPPRSKLAGQSPFNIPGCKARTINLQA